MCLVPTSDPDGSPAVYTISFLGLDAEFLTLTDVIVRYAEVRSVLGENAEYVVVRRPDGTVLDAEGIVSGCGALEAREAEQAGV